MPGTNTLAYYKNLQVTAVESLIVQAPGVNVRRLLHLGRLLQKYRIVQSQIFVPEGTFGKVKITFDSICNYSVIRYSVLGLPIKNKQLFHYLNYSVNNSISNNEGIFKLFTFTYSYLTSKY